MSRTVDLFIDSDQPIERLAASLGEITGKELVALPDRCRFTFRDGAVMAYLSEHDFLDDDDLPLSEFRYVLSAPVSRSSNVDDGPEIGCLRRVNAQLRRAGALPSLLVIDLERPGPAQADQA